MSEELTVFPHPANPTGLKSGRAHSILLAEGNKNQNPHSAENKIGKSIFNIYQHAFSAITWYKRKPCGRVLI